MENERQSIFPVFPSPFWLKRSTICASSSSRSFSEFTCVHRADSLALTRYMVTRRMVLSRFSSHSRGCFATFSGLHFIQARRFTQRYGWSSILHEDTSSIQLRVAPGESGASRHRPTSFSSRRFLPAARQSIVFWTPTARNEDYGLSGNFTYASTKFLIVLAAGA